MPTDLSLRCACGQVRGVARAASPATGNRMVCYCDDCQAYAHYLDRAHILDAHGGTEVFQVAPRTVEITAGREQLRCLRLLPKGAYRWYAGCCKTPIANTVAKVPFVGLVHTFLDVPDRDAALGRPVGYVNGRYAIGGTPAHADARVSLRTVGRVIRVMLGWIARRQTKPSPFFADGKPIVTPHVLTPVERKATYERVQKSGVPVTPKRLAG